MPDFNPRDLDEQYEAEIADLLAHILAGGTIPPLEVVARADGCGVEIVDGHRRYDAMSRALPRKVVSPLIGGVDTFVKALDANQKAALLDIQEGRVADTTITIDARVLRGLFAAHGALETVRAKQAEKQRQQADAAAATTQAEIPTEH